MNNYKLIYSIGGFLIGALTGGLIVGKYCQKHEEKTISDLEEYYGRTDEYVRKPVDDISDDYERNDEEEEMVHRDSREEIREKLRRNQQRKEEIVNYHHMYKEKSEQPENEETENIPEEEEVSENEYINKEYQDWQRKHANDEPKIISIDAIGDLPAWITSQSLLYYQLDDILTNDEGELIENEAYTVGECLDQYNFRNSDEDIIYVLNANLEAVYEIQKIRSAYSDTYGETGV